ncbi:MAG: hypothetical protein M0042_07545 [Nitrospiraceae bacterium]|nr:hypothetical protein [Nitrospiraceae bacterium]
MNRYSPVMRWTAVILLITVFCGLLVPPAIGMVLAAGGVTSLGMIDVCHSSTPALTAGGEMPFLGECVCAPAPVAATAVVHASPLLFSAVLHLPQDERPPKA